MGALGQSDVRRQRPHALQEGRFDGALIHWTGHAYSDKVLHLRVHRYARVRNRRVVTMRAPVRNDDTARLEALLHAQQERVLAHCLPRRHHRHFVCEREPRMRRWDPAYRQSTAGGVGY